MTERISENKCSSTCPPERKALEPCAVRETKKGNLRRKKFLETATRLFLEKGFDDTSLNEIVKISGGSLSTIYKCFGDKKKLFFAVFEFSLEQTRSDLEKIPLFTLNDENPREYLRRSVEVIYHGGFEKKFLCFFPYGIRNLSFRSSVLNVVEDKIIAPFRQIFQRLENKGVRFVLGREETLLTMIRLIRGTALEFIIDDESLMKRKEMAISQTMAILQKLIEFPTMTDTLKATDPVKADNFALSRSKKQTAAVERRSKSENKNKESKS